MIYLIGEAPKSDLYSFGEWDVFKEWALLLTDFELDIETDVSPFWCNKKLITIQLGYAGIQWVLQKSVLTQEQWEWLSEYLRDLSRVKMIHHAQFEYIVLRFNGIEIGNVFDTMVAEKILTGGIENANYSLSDLSEKYLGYALDKSEQTTFGDDILTENKVVYAATDVRILQGIKDKQMPQIKQWNLDTVLNLEMKVVLSLGEMTYHGMDLDLVKWEENEEWAKPFIVQSHQELNQWLIDDVLLNQRAKKLGYISDTDTLEWNLNAPLQKRELLNLLFPSLDGATKPIIQKFIRNAGLAPDDIMLLQDMVEKDYARFQDKLISNHRQYLIEHGYLIPAGEVKLNWNSVPQTLPLLQAIHPKLKDLSDESVAKTNHPVFESLSNYKDSLKLVSTYGMGFVEKFLEPDGRIRTEYNQIVSTGRLSSKRPNMQNIPAKENIGLRYRNAFVCHPDFEFVDGDYISAELVIISFISKDPVWMEAIDKGWDLHSICAELVFGKKWLEAKSDGCAYYAMDGDKQLKEKCKCKGHKTLRNFVKSINFGLAYGMTEYKLSATMKSTVQEAKNLMEDYFRAFPKIKAVLKYLSDYGIKNGYSKTPAPFFRKRWYPFWKHSQFRVNTHLAGIEYDSNLAAIGRQSSNAPIQGCNADLTKQALVYIYEWIRANNMQDKIFIVAQIHDQITTVCHKSVSAMWKVKMDELMCDAAKVVIPTGILKADVQVTPFWTK